MVDSGRLTLVLEDIGRVYHTVLGQMMEMFRLYEIKLQIIIRKINEFLV